MNIIILVKLIMTSALLFRRSKHDWPMSEHFF